MDTLMDTQKWESSALQTIHMKYQDLFSMKKN